MEDLSKGSAPSVAHPSIKITIEEAPLSVIDASNQPQGMSSTPGTRGHAPRAPSIDPIIEARVLRKLDARVPVLAAFLCIVPNYSITYLRWAKKFPRSACVLRPIQYWVRFSPYFHFYNLPFFFIYSWPIATVCSGNLRILLNSPTLFLFWMSFAFSTINWSRKQSDKPIEMRELQEWKRT